MDNKILMSREKYNELVFKLNHLRKSEFVANREEMKIAIERGGGMHDNAGYEHAAQYEKIILKKIQELESILSKVKIIENYRIDTNSVNIGTEVKVLNLENSEEIKYTIVGAYGTDLDSKNNYISYLAPLANGLLGKWVGEIAEIKVPSGVLRFKILDIQKAQN
ncbi:MAG: GreA/GreB family elongation factor [bacterium]